MLPPIESNRIEILETKVISSRAIVGEYRTQRGLTRSIIRTRVAVVSLRFIRQTFALTKRPDLLDGANSSGSTNYSSPLRQRPGSQRVVVHAATTKCEKFRGATTSNGDILEWKVSLVGIGWISDVISLLARGSLILIER